ncbi:WD40-repeat-containing domain protein, partial [Parasitella parasitica]
TKTKHKKTNQEFSRLMLAQSIQTCHKPDLASLGSSNKHEYNNHYRMASDSSTEPSPNHPYGAIWVLKFSKDGCYLASGGQNCVVYLWKLLDQNTQDVPEYSINVLEEKPHMEYIGHKADILDLAWSKNNFLLSSSMDHSVRLWHTTQKDCLCVFQHLNFVTSIEFHPKDDRFFLSGSMDGRIRIWSIPEKRVAFWNEIPGNRLVTAAGFTLDGKAVVAGSHDGHCYFFETQSFKYITQICVNSDMTSNRNSSSKKGPKITGIEMMPGMTPGDEKLLVTSNDSKVSDDGRYIISGSEDCHTYIWRTEQSSVSPLHHLHESRNKALSVFGHVGESTMNFSSATRHLDNLSAPTLQRNEPLPTSPKHSQQQTRFSKWLKKRDDPKDKIRSRTEYFEAHDYVVTAAIFAPAKTRQHIAKSRQDTIYNNTPLHLQRQPTGSSNGSHSSASFAEDDQYSEGHILVTADFRGLIKVWRIDSGTYGNQQNISTLQIDTQSLHPSLAPSELSTTSLNGSGARSVSSPSPKVRKNFGLFSPRHSK